MTSPCAFSVDSTSTLRPWTFFASPSRSSGEIGVGLRNSTRIDAVTVDGGWSAPALAISACAAVQLLWQSSIVEITPPLRNLPKAWW